MKVIKVIGTLDFGGIEKIFEITALYYKEDKKDIIFLCLGKGGATEKAIRDLGYRVIVWNADGKIPNWALIGRLVTFFRQERPDVVHASGAEAIFHGIVAAWLCRVRVRIAEEIGQPDHSPIARRIFRLVYGLATGVHACAISNKEYMVAAGEVRAERVDILNNPVDVRKFDRGVQGKNQDTFVVASVCRLDPIKNLGLLIRGMAYLKQKAGERKVALWLVGDGPSRTELEALVLSLGISDIVTFWGFQSQPVSYLQQASLFVLPSISEGFPIAAGEAMLTETPSIVTKVGGGGEFVIHGENGWLLDPLDQAGFNELLASIADLSAEQRTAIGKRGRETALEKFSPDRYLQKLWDLYRRSSNSSANTYGKDQSTALS